MKELSLNVLDITENSVKAGASLTEISIIEDEKTLTLSICDNGHGMTEEILKNVTDPFYTSRTTRKVGMGLPLLKLAAEQTGGYMTVESVSEKDDPINKGTKVKAFFHTDSIDFTPLGDIISTVCTLIQGHPDTDFKFTHVIKRGPEEKTVNLDTRELRSVLGDEVSLGEYEVITWIHDYMEEQYT